MTSRTGRSGWDALGAALGGDRGEQRVATPAGWSQVRDALTATGPSKVAGEPEAEPGGTPAAPGASPRGWAKLRSALAPSATAVLDRPDTDSDTEVDPAPDTDLGAEPKASAAEDTDGAAGVTGTAAGEVPPAARDGRRRRRPPAALARVWSTRAGKAGVAVVAAGAVAAGVLAGVTAGGGLPSDVAFAVDGHDVTLSQFSTELQVRQTLYGIQPPAQSDTAKYKAYLTSAAQAEAVSTLLDRLAPAQGVTVSQQTARAKLDQAVNNQYGGDRTKFTQALGAAGLNENQVLDEITHNLVYQELFSKIVGSPKVTDAQVTQYFNDHKSALAIPETRQISHIVASTQAAAQAIVKQLQGGTSFATLAASQSLDTSTRTDGGQLGNYAKDDLQPAFAGPAFSAQPNVPFGPVKDQAGWDIGVVTAVHPAQPATLDQKTSTAIRTVLIDQAEADKWDAWLGAQIKKANIVYAAKYRPAHPDQPPPIPIPKLTGETLAGVGAAQPAGAPAGAPTPTQPSGKGG